MASVVVSTDGYVGVAGAAGWAFVARGDRNAVVRGDLPPGSPSHLAEWVAAREALRWAEAKLRPGDALELRTDSALVQKGLASRRPVMSGEAAEHRAECRRALARLAEGGVQVHIVRVPRAENVEADAHARPHPAPPDGDAA